MNRKALLVAALALSLLLVGLFSLNGGLVALALPLLVYLGAALYFSPGEERLAARRALSDERVRQSTGVTVSLTLANTGGDLPEVLMEDKHLRGLAVTAGATRTFGALPRGGELTLQYTLSGVRGMYFFNYLRVTASDPFDLFNLSTWIDSPNRLIVKPESPALRQVRIRPPQTRGFAGPILARQSGSGVDFFGVREYQLGDPIRRLNWKVSARHPREIFTNQFEQERLADVGIILDARAQTNMIVEGESLFEHSVHATAALADALLKDGNRVGLLVYGSGMESAFPGYGRIQHERILETLARTNPGHNYALERLDYLPTRFFPARSQIILISPLVPEDTQVLLHLRGRGYAVAVVSPDLVHFEQRITHKTPREDLAVRIANLERALLFQKLRRAGVQVVDWKTDESLPLAVHAAFGRVILRNPPAAAGSGGRV